MNGRSRYKRFHIGMSVDCNFDPCIKSSIDNDTRSQLAGTTGTTVLGVRFFHLIIRHTVLGSPSILDDFVGTNLLKVAHVVNTI